MTRTEIEARIKELSQEFHHCSLCDRPKHCSGLAMCVLGEISEEEESLRAKLKAMDTSR